jgi:CrcB protein
MIKNIALVALGGGAGSAARYLCQKWFAENVMHPFPWGTFAVNMAGCFLLGVIYAIAEKTAILSPQTRLLLITGFCGGFTTFSAFAFENMTLLRSGDVVYFLLYSLGSVAIGVVAVIGGITFVKLV